MGELNNLFVSSSYQGLLKLTDSTNGLTNTLQTVQSGNGVNGPLQMSRTAVNISGSFFINNVPVTGTTSGTSGTSGAAGSNGTSGTSGSSGTSGTGFVIAGDWDNATNYVVGDVVYYNGSSYVAIQNNVNKIPSIQPPFWQLFSAAGSNGTSGTSGASGSSGSAGSDGSSGTSGDSLFALTGSVWNTTNDLGITGSLNQSGTFYPDQIDWINSSIVQGTGSYVLTTNTSGVTQYDTYQNIAGALSPFINSNRNGLITTGSVGVRQFMSGSLSINTFYPENIILSNVAPGGNNILGADYSNFGSAIFGYWASVNFSGVTVSGPGVSNSTISTVNYTSYVELGLTSGTTTAGANYTLNGPYYDIVDITGSIRAIDYTTSTGVNGANSRILVDYVSSNNNDYSGELQAGLIQLRPNTNGDIIQFAANSGSLRNGGGQFAGPQIAGYTQTNGDISFIGFEADSNFTDGTVSILTPLKAISGATITGSLIVRGNTTISGALVGNAVNNGLIQIRTEASLSGSVQLNISSSSPVSQSNLIFGGGGPTPAQLTGSIVISGSNNIMFSNARINTLVTQGTYGYIGSNNIGNSYPTLNTASLVSPIVNNNNLNGALTLAFTTSSVLAVPSISNNNIIGSTIINHPSGSVSFTSNNVVGGGLTSNAAVTTLSTLPQIFNNVIAGGTTTLNHNSSSIALYFQNIGGGVTVQNNYSSSVSTAVNNINVQRNTFGGNSNIITVSGSNSANRRQFNDNVIFGNSNRVNSDYSTSTTGHLVATALLGQALIVSASHTSALVGGTVIVGRYNATGSLQESSNDAVFVVGSGPNDANRRNAIHVDSANNTRITGSVNISGSLTLNGVAVGGSDRNGLITTGSIGGSQSIIGTLSTFALNSTRQNLGESLSFTGSRFTPTVLTSTDLENTNNTTFAFNQLHLGDNLTGTQLKLNTNKASNFTEVTLNARYSGQSDSFISVENNNTGASICKINARSVQIQNGTLNVQNGITGSLNGNADTATTASFALNANADRNGLITTGSGFGTQTITTTLKVDNILELGSGSISHIRSGGGNNIVYWDSTVNNFGLGNVPNIGNLSTGSINNTIITPSFSNFLSGSNNLVIAGGFNFFNSGSNNILIGNSITSGSQNVIIGATTLPDGATNSFSLGGVGSNVMSLQPGQDLQIRFGTTISGSLNITGQYLVNGVPITGSAGDRNGLITTGSAIGGSQSITGSLVVSGSNGINIDRGNLTVNNGNAYVYGIAGGIASVAIAGRGGQDSQLGLDSINGNLQETANSAGIRVVKAAAQFGQRYGLYVGNYGGPGGNPVNGIFISSSIAAGAGNFMGFNAPTSSVTLGNYVFANSDATQTRVFVSGSLSAIGDIRFASGSNTTMGTVALNGANPGTATVSNTLVTANSLIFLTKQTNNHPNAGPVVVSSKGSSTFTITSNHNGDTDVVAYQIINPA